MNTVSIHASRDYDVRIGAGLLAQLGARAKAFCPGGTVCLAADDTVYGLYGRDAEECLENAGLTVHSFVFSHGEQSKSGGTFFALLNFLAEHSLTRSDLLIALGGGVTGDLGGFTASCYLRGIPYMQVPTSLLAMVDSSVGGKTAIDLDAGKNLCGAFYQPVEVLCDTALLQTLPRDIFRDGCAEVIKYGILGSKSLFERLKNQELWKEPEQFIADCVAMKGHFVEADERDRGLRQQLNLGHTLGHAVEAGSGFSLSHGQSVAIGTAMIARAAAKFGFCTDGTRDEILELLQQYDLPTETAQPADFLYETALRDKKRQGSTISLVVPREIGTCELVKIPVEELMDWINAGY